MSKAFLFKIIIAGSGGCGKSTLLERFTTGKFTSETKMTIGIDFAVNYIGFPEGKVTLQIWDFGGEDRFRIMLPAYSRGAQGCLLVFDLTRPKTFFELDEWIKIVRSSTKDIPIILLGTKFDLLDPKLGLPLDSNLITEWMITNKIDAYLNISSLSGHNVQESFESLSKLMMINKESKKRNFRNSSS